MESPIVTIKRTVNLAEYIMKHYPAINLRRNGRVYKGLCPFHNEKDPSFTVFPDSRYKCFSCPKQTSGDIINFVVNIEGISPKEACELIAEQEGLDIQFVEPNQNHEAYIGNMMAHNRRYWSNLMHSPNTLSYLAKRGITQETITTFRLGLTDSNESQFRNDLMYINSRLVFPIMEMRPGDKARTLGMGYRTLNPDESPKYKNDMNHDDPSDPLCGVFSKGKLLYGYPQAYQAIKDKDYVIVVEGYFDVLALHQSKIENVVATMGTSFTREQMELLRNRTKNILLLYDGDKAGIQSMESKLEDLFELGFSVNLCILDNEMDPADLCLLYQFDHRTILSYFKLRTEPAMSYMIERYTKQYQQETLRLRLNALSILSPLLDKISTTEKVVWKDLLNKKLDING